MSAEWHPAGDPKIELADLQRIQSTIPNESRSDHSEPSPNRTPGTSYPGRGIVP